MKGVFTSAFVLLVFSLVSVFGRKFGRFSHLREPDFSPLREFKPIRELNPIREFNPIREELNPIREFNPIRELKPFPIRELKPFRPIDFRLTTKKPFLDLTLPQVSPPRVNFQCGRRGSIRIVFGGFNSPFFAVSSPSSGFSPLSAQLKRKKRATDNRHLVAEAFQPDRHEPEVVGGVVSHKNSWPWMVLLGRKVGPSKSFFCSGVLINAQHVLTAAHCVLDLDPFFIRLGEHDHSVSGGQSRAPEDVNVDDVIFHPKYAITQGYHDVAVIKLVRPVEIRNEIRPICLPWGNTMNEDLVHQKVTVTGWGQVEFGGSASMVLQEVKIDVFEPSVCHKSYSTLRDFVKSFPKGLNRQNIVCAGSPLGGKAACQGDSGGPMVHESPDSSYTLAGIISKGYGCGKADFPGLFTPIRNFDTLTWIKKTAF